MKKVLFITGTRADFGKLKPLILASKSSSFMNPVVAVTGMHMLPSYGSTHKEAEELGVELHKFPNQFDGEPDYSVLSNSLIKLGNLVEKESPDLIVVHGDRIEPLAGALVGVHTNTRVGHIEGGEISGTVDDSYRHAITKLSHAHFTANEDSRARLLQLGERSETIWVIGSPELDVVNSSSLPDLAAVRKRYRIPFEEYAIAILHPVATDSASDNFSNATNFFTSISKSAVDYVVIESNNDRGSAQIRAVLRGYKGHPAFRIVPSMRFEYFLTLLRNSKFIIGNSSTGVREAPHYGIPSVNVGLRQHRRAAGKLIVNSSFEPQHIIESIALAESQPRKPQRLFGEGDSAPRFVNALESEEFWQIPIQKTFHDLA